MKRRIIVPIIGVIILIAIYFFSSIITIKQNERELKEHILSLSGDVEKVNLIDITSFEWEKAYFFAPYTRKEIISEAIGFRWYGIKETNNDSQMQVVFTKGNKVVCYSYGTPISNGYYFDTHYITDSYVVNGKIKCTTFRQ